MQISLSDLTLRSLTEGEYWDQKLPSFGVRVGKRSTTFLLKKGNRRVRLGSFPALSLQDARKRAHGLKADPETNSIKITFKEALTLFYEIHCKHYRPKVLYETKRYLAKYPFENQNLSKISTHHVYQTIDAQSHAEANKLFTVSRTFFRFCVRRRLIPKSPLEGLQIPNKETSRARVLSDQELKSIYQTVTRESSAFNSIVALLILTGQRRGEIASIQSSWVDLENKTLTIPASATKNAREHTIPISSTAQTLLSFCKKDGLFFQARGSTNRPFCGWSKSKVTLDKLCGVKNWTLHDIRRTYRTIHARIGTPPHIAERLVNHVSSRSAMQDVYDRHTYLPEMRQAVENYEKYLQSIGVG